MSEKALAAVLIGPNEFDLRELDVPEIANDAALLAVEACGICGSDIHNAERLGNGVKILGLANMPGRLAADTSSLFARNHFNFLSPFIKEGALALDDEDELVKGIRLTGNGAVVHPNFAVKEG